MLTARKREKAARTELSSRLLPRLLDADRLANQTPVRVLDFGRVNGDTLDFFSEQPCRVQILDATATLVQFAARDRDPDAPDSAESLLTDLFSEMEGRRFNTVLLWDTVNLIAPDDLPGFFRFLACHLHDGCRGHGFLLHKRSVVSCVRHFGVRNDSTLEITGESPATLYLHNRKHIAEAMAPMKIDQAVLHGDGRQEFLFS